MPTVGWILESATERFWEGQPPPVLVNLPPPVFRCLWCEKAFASPEDLRLHLNLEHPLELPVLYVQGKPLLKKSVIRAIVEEGDVEVYQCSHCEVQIDGGLWQTLAAPEFRKQFSQAKNATWNIRLVHQRRVDDSQATEEYHVRFCIPNNAALNTVDEHFIRTLVHDNLDHSDLEQFEAGLPLDAPAREYGNALGNYALGIILKERRCNPRALIDFAEFMYKMHSAHEVLCHFHRPVALAASGSICFSANEFHGNEMAATELEVALRFFRIITSTGSSAGAVSPVMPMPPETSIEKVCPIDHISHRLLLACSQLSREGTLTLACLNGLQRLASGTILVSEQDLVKIHVICAEGYLRLGNMNEALLHLRAIQFDPVFKDWTQRRMEEASTYGR